MAPDNDADTKEICPFINSPSKDCYCYEINSGKVQDALRYCNAFYKLCPVYQSLRLGKDDSSILPGTEGEDRS